MLKRIGALAVALMAGAVVLPAAAQAEECYRRPAYRESYRAPYGAYGYVQGPTVVYGAPYAQGYVDRGYGDRDGWRAREWREHEWRERERREHERREWRERGHYR